jgi:hypothetical protein
MPIIGETSLHKTVQSLRELWQRSVGTDLLVDGSVTTPKIADNAVTTLKIGNDQVTYAKLQDISAQFRVLGRNSSGAGDPEEVTFSQFLDWVGSAAHGDVLYRGASAWARLAAGTAGQFLQTQGAGQGPQWAAGGLELVNSGTVASAAQLDIVLSSFTAFRGVRVLVDSLVPATDDVELHLLLSTDGGSTFATTSYEYGLNGMRSDSDTMIFRRAQSAAQCVIAGLTGAGDALSNVAGEGGAHVVIDWLTHLGTARNPRLFVSTNWYSANADAMGLQGHAGRANGNVHNALRLICESGNIASARWAVYGYR